MRGCCLGGERGRGGVIGVCRGYGHSAGREKQGRTCPRMKELAQWSRYRVMSSEPEVTAGVRSVGAPGRVLYTAPYTASYISFIGHITCPHRIDL